MGNAFGLTTFETVDFILGGANVALNLLAPQFHASQWFKADAVSDETIAEMRFLGVLLLWGRALNYLCVTSKDKEMKYKAYLMGGAVYAGLASLLVLNRDTIDESQVYVNLPIFSAMAGGFFLLAPGVKKEDKKD